MNIIRSVSVLVLFFGLLILTSYVTKSYYSNCNNKIFKEKKEKKPSTHDSYLEYDSDRPTKVYKQMFTDSSVWMGYTDSDVKDGPDNMNNYSTFDSQKYSSIS